MDVEPTEAGSVTPSNSEAEEGESIRITALVNEHWVFDRWQGDHRGTSNPASVSMDSDKNVTALFVKRDYPLTVNVEGEGSVEEKVVNTKNTDYEHGTVVELTAVPTDGWYFSHWSGSVESEENPETLEVDSEREVTAVFERRDYPLTINIEGEGTVSEEVIQAKTTEYPYETVVQLTANPLDGWSFIEWSGDFSSNESQINISVNNELVVKALFEKTFYLHDNGITIMCPNANVGEKGIVEGVEYEAVDKNLVIQRLDENKDLTKVCTSLVIDMVDLFRNRDFNQPIGNWDVSNVTDMSGLFWNSNFDELSNFNQSIEEWDVSSVKSMYAMFRGTVFDKNIEKWDVSNVTGMSSMFRESQFNQPIESWDVGNVTQMSGMFVGAEFNQPLNKWDVSNVERMSMMFNSAEFNQPIGDWDVSSVVDMSNMFFINSTFNQPIGNWDVSNVENMRLMFHTSVYNHPLDGWDVGKVTNTVGMFARSSFNQPIGNWDVSNVESMYNMFGHSPYNYPLNEWDVSNVSEMDLMFRNTNFNQPINKWCVSNIISEPSDFATDSPLVEENKPIWGTCPE
ncbi:BspA family leucine-rich repeat surface protein [Rhodohalobacter barkolensis]|uniref:BspA family leucine-rich repeat surface protein n=1 Tax=Rhodohalobacter barkolensis TaxID=2053187 RepID=UPI0013FD680E|nr:BspA family leucine-rich repeat surface protein [Rhodohalobacter barkolensis]